LGALVVAFEDDEASMLLAKRLQVHKRAATPQYVKSTVPAPNAWQCHSGTKVITTNTTCFAACQGLGGSTNVNRHINKAEWRWPNGCYMRLGQASSAAKNQNCIFNVHDQSKPMPIHAQYDGTVSICEQDTPTDKHITVIGRTSKQTWANSNGNFYISFPGDPNEYSLYTGGNDFVKGRTDKWPLTVLAGADLSQPTIFIKEHNDAWIPDKITIEEGGVEKFSANGLKAIIDGNCYSSGMQWGSHNRGKNLYCAKSITWPFQEITVTVKTHTASWANSNGKILMKFTGDHRQYILDNPRKNDFEKGQTDEFKLLVQNGVDVSGPIELSIKSNDGWAPVSIEVSSGGVTHQLTTTTTGTVLGPVFWLDGNCAGKTQKLAERMNAVHAI
jgi:hypothetical protein